LPALASSAEPFHEASFCETLIRSCRGILQCSICEAGEISVLLAINTQKCLKPWLFCQKMGFLRVSVDTNTCGAPLYTCHSYGGLYYTKLPLNVQ